MYPAYDTPHKICNIRGIQISSNPDYPPIMQANPCVSSNAPSLDSSGEPGHPRFDCCFLMRREANVRGAQTLIYKYIYIIKTKNSMSVCLSVRPSVRPPARLSVCLSILYIYINIYIILYYIILYYIILYYIIYIYIYMKTSYIFPNEVSVIARVTIKVMKIQIFINDFVNPCWYQGMDE